MVVATQKTFIFTNLTSPYLTVNKNGSKLPAITLAKKKDISETSTPQQQNFPIKLSTSLLPRAAIAVFGLGFIDAGYSGDWSRIGVISEENEALLKTAAFVVVPLCIFLIVYLSREPEAEP
ncbi:uncharacterized protein LOC123195124 [Mangifera indica]|uniref:uncharacterized protein LOC123195124 n=1 Tax=Mangifera indica TaxID=29780 RepID=UPI001CFAF71F|nr:uncharacterized protein LOC123195124 [Mangifera indica]